MKLPKLAIENHQFTMVVTVLLVLFGLVSSINMPKSEDPQISGVGTTVFVVLPGSSPADVERLIVDPIEEALNELEDIKVIESQAENSLAIVAIEFDASGDPDEKYSDVVQKVNSVREKLPTNVATLETIKWTVTDVYILQLALTSEAAAYSEMEHEADQLKKNLEKVSGVKRVELWAVPQQQVRVSIDLKKLAQLNIPLNYVMGAILDANGDIPGGQIDIGNKRLNVKTSGAYESLEEIEQTVIHAQGGHPVYLKDVADVEMEHEDVAYQARVNGKRCIFVTVNQKEGTNIFSIFKRLNQTIETYQERLPSNMALERVFDQSVSVKNRVRGFFMNLLQGIFLVGLVIFAAVSSRASIIVMIAIPISIMIGIGLLDMSQYGLEQMSIAGLVIALGLLVDNAIVVTENTARFMRMGHNRKDAAVLGTSQVGWAVVSATATTLLAFIPIIMMQDMTGKFIRSMPLTVVYTLAASLFVSLTLTPYLSTRFLKVDRGNHERPFRKILRHFIEKHYRSILHRALNAPKRTILLAVIAFIVSLTLFPLVGVSFFPKAEKPQFFITVDMPAGTNLKATDDVAHYVEKTLAEYPNIKHVTVNVGHGNPRVYYNVQSQRQMSSHAHIMVEMASYNRSQLNQMVRELRDKFNHYPGARIQVKELEQGPPVDAPIQIRVMGNDLDILKKISIDVENIMKSQLGAVNVYNPLATTKSDIRVNIDREKSAMLGVSLAEIDRTVRASLTGLTLTQYRDSEGKEYDLVIRLPLTDIPTLDDFNRIYVSSRTGALIPLNQLASIELEASPLLISHYNLDRNVSLTADVEGDASVQKVTLAIVDQLKAYQWPKGYSYEIGGEMESREESFGGMGQAMIIAMIAIFGVLVLQFRSYAQPFIVFSALPLAIIGSILALLITGNSFSFAAFIGLCSLVGIVVNNSIILVDYTNQLRREGKPILEALKEAGETRFIPIVLTTMTTVGGLLPLTLAGGSLWEPMGWTIIGGLLTSTALTLVIVPVLYKIYSPAEFS